MNPELKFEYEVVDIPGWKGVRCIIGIEGQQFTSLGLEKGQTKLTDEQFAWFQTNGDSVVVACKSALEICKKTKDKPTTDFSIEFTKTIKNKHDLLDKFCDECKIKDS